MSDWSLQRVEQLAPDAAAIKAGQGLAKPAKWQNLGRSDRFLWGECQGSGANPYQVRIDLEDGASKCTCPSRKLPCKHTLGLLFMFAGGTPTPTAPMPGFVEEWSAARTKRAEAKATRAAAPEKPPDPEAQSKRIEKREGRIDSGLAQLEAWLSDMIAQGLATARAQPPQFWGQMAKRLVDAQAPGLARRVRDVGDLALSSPEWQSELLAGLARLQLLIDAYRRLDQLPLPLAAEVRALVGWTQPQDVLLERTGSRQRWHVLGHRQTGQDLHQLRVQYTWLAGQQSGEMALILDFAVGNQPFPAALRTGQVTDAELVYFDGEPPLRALIKQRFDSGPIQPSLPAPVDVLAMQAGFASLLARNPWLDTWPVVLGPVTIDVRDETVRFVDATGRSITAQSGLRHGWHLDALGGGTPLILFGHWNGHVFDPVTVEHEGRLFSLAQLGELPVLSKVA